MKPPIAKRLIVCVISLGDRKRGGKTGLVRHLQESGPAPGSGVVIRMVLLLVRRDDNHRWSYVRD